MVRNRLGRAGDQVGHSDSDLNVITEKESPITGIRGDDCSRFANTISGKKTNSLYQKFSHSGLRRGIVLSILNPLAIPYWLGVTTYLKSRDLIVLSSLPEIQFYLAGVVFGALLLLILSAYLARKIKSQFQENLLLKRLPGYVLLTLGVYSLIQYFL